MPLVFLVPELESEFSPEVNVYFDRLDLEMFLCHELRSHTVSTYIRFSLFFGFPRFRSHQECDCELQKIPVVGLEPLFLVRQHRNLHFIYKILDMY